MSKAKEAIAEAIIIHIREEDLEEILNVLSSAADEDVSIWREVLRYELNSSKLLDEIVQFDIVVPKLIMYEVKTMSAFHFAALRGAELILESFLNLSIPVDMCLENGSTALHLACFADKQETVALLLNNFHADINRHDRQVKSTYVCF